MSIPISWRRAVRTRWVAVILIVCITIVVAAMVCYRLWLSSTGDLAAVIAMAKSQSIATSTAEMGFVTDAPERVKQWERLATLSGRIGFWGRRRNSAESLQGTSLAVGTPIPDALLQFHDSIDPQDLSDLLSLVDALDSGPIILRSDYSMLSIFPELQTVRAVNQLLVQRVDLAPPEDLLREIDRLLSCSALLPDQSLTHCFASVGCLVRALNAISRRLPDIRTDRAQVADAISRRIKVLPQSFATSLVGSFAMHVALFTTLAPQLRLDQFGSACGGNGWDWLPNAAVIRLGRAHVLRDELIWMQIVHLQQYPSTLMQLAMEADDRQEQTVREGPGGALTAIFAMPHHTIYLPVHRAILHAQLLMAELLGRPWPADPFDPQHRPLRPLQRHGRVVGAYSLGESVEDLQGKKPNYYFALLEPLMPHD
jgi:hypothetical protein